MATDGLLLFWSDFSTSRAGWGTALRWRESSLPWRDWTTLVLEVLIKFINLREVQISKPSFSSICFNWYSLSLSLSLSLQACSSAIITCQHCGENEWSRRDTQGNDCINTSSPVVCDWMYAKNVFQYQTHVFSSSSFFVGRLNI
jgi:hypothetical protein